MLLPEINSEIENIEFRKGQIDEQTRSPQGTP